MTCLETGCSGTVVDGYCDICGTAPASGKGRVDVDGTDGVDASFARFGPHRVVQVRRHPRPPGRRGGDGPARAAG